MVAWKGNTSEAISPEIDVCSFIRNTTHQWHDPNMRFGILSLFFGRNKVTAQRLFTELINFVTFIRLLDIASVFRRKYTKSYRYKFSGKTYAREITHSSFPKRARKKIAPISNAILVCICTAKLDSVTQFHKYTHIFFHRLLELCLVCARQIHTYLFIYLIYVDR